MHTSITQSAPQYHGLHCCDSLRAATLLASSTSMFSGEAACSVAVLVWRTHLTTYGPETLHVLAACTSMLDDPCSFWGCCFERLRFPICEPGRLLESINCTVPHSASGSQRVILLKSQSVLYLSIPAKQARLFQIHPVHREANICPRV